MPRIAILLLLVTIASCQGNRAVKQSGTSVSENPSTSNPEPLPNFYKRYSGSIAGKPVVVQLHCWNGSLQGSYQYRSSGQVIVLRDWMDSVRDDQYILVEFPGTGQEQNAVQTASWSIHFEGDRIKGEWHSGDEIQQGVIDLQEDFPQGSRHFHTAYLADSISLAAARPGSPKAVATTTYLLPDDADSNLILQYLSAMFPDMYKDLSIESHIHRNNQLFFNDYRKINLHGLGVAGDSDENFTLNYTHDQNISILYNENNWVVFQDFISTYTGGAHGNCSCSFTNLDVINHRAWSVLDIITDTTALRPLLNDAAIEYFKLKPGDNMQDRLLIDQVPPTANVFISGYGLTFVYNPYEIASYADGQVSLFLPYRKLLPFLTPAFLNRMQLNPGTGSSRI